MSTLQPQASKAKHGHEMDLTQEAVFETGCFYIVPSLESLKLLKGVSAAANPKSFTGRLDIFTRVNSAGTKQQLDVLAHALPRVL